MFNMIEPPSISVKLQLRPGSAASRTLQEDTILRSRRSAYLKPFLKSVRLGSGFAKVDPEILFDRDFYGRTNPDVRAAGVDVYQHYIGFGATEGRSPHPLFDPAFYRSQLTGTVADPLAHYLEIGGKSGLFPNPLFDSAWYIATYADVRRAGQNPLVHYVRWGVKENRRPGPLFDTGWYLSTYPDVAAAGKNPLADYLNGGGQFGRNPCAEFDSNWYLHTYPEVRKGAQNPLVHFLLSGHAEGRRFVPSRYAR